MSNTSCISTDYKSEFYSTNSDLTLARTEWFPHQKFNLNSALSLKCLFSLCRHRRSPERKTVWLCPGKAETDVLTFPCRELLWSSTALISKQCCCSPCPPPSRPPLPLQTCCCLLPLQLLQFFTRHISHQVLHAKSFLYHYPYFLPYDFIVLPSCYLSTQFCSAISAVPVLPNLCSCQRYCLL